MPLLPFQRPRWSRDCGITRYRHGWILGLCLITLAGVWAAWPGIRPAILLPVALFGIGLLEAIAERRWPPPSWAYALTNFAAIFVAMFLTQSFAPGGVFDGWSVAMLVPALVAGSSTWNLIRPAPSP